MTNLPSLGPRGEGWVIVQLLLLAAVVALGPLGGPVWSGPPATVTFVLGLALIVAGAALLGWGIVGLGLGLTPLPRPRDDATLVVTGAYARVRHPLYGGLVLAAFGWGLLLASPAALLVAGVLWIFFEFKSRREEAWLAARFEAYAGYAARTRRFIPWLH